MTLVLSVDLIFPDDSCTSTVLTCGPEEVVEMMRPSFHASLVVVLSTTMTKSDAFRSLFDFVHFDR